MSAESDAREVAALLTRALAGADWRGGPAPAVELRVDSPPPPGGAKTPEDGRPRCGRAFRARLAVYRDYGWARLYEGDVADGGWRRARGKACAALLREFGSAGRAGFYSPSLPAPVVLPAAGSPEELELRLTAGGFLRGGENPASPPA